MNNQNTPNKGGGIAAIIVIILFFVIAFASCGSSCSGSSKSDIAYDEDGFLGYSDSFWEWYADNN